ncbi:MAG: hypothetical protein J6G98_00265 [Bacilli bacterium]|nr:hypothetical protein [Bacilli bacterium]
MKEKLECLMTKMNEIKYGYVIDGVNIYSDLENDKEMNEDFPKLYHLLSPDELIKNKHGVCWDQVELERYYLSLDNIVCSSYFIVEYDDKFYPTHTFVVVSCNNKFYWFEHSWYPYRGIHEYDSLNELLKDVKLKFSKDKNIDDIVIYNYEKPKYGISSNEFFKHCEEGKRVNI